MKDILIITPYSEEVGGVEIVTNQLSRFLKSKNYNVDFLTLKDCEAPQLFEKILVKFFGSPYLTAKAFKKLKKNYELVICNGEFAWGISHPKCFVYFHGSYAGLKKSTSKGISFKSKLALSWRAYLQKRGAENKTVVAVSSFLKKLLLDQGINCRYVISNPVDLSVFSPKQHEKKGDYLFVGRFDYFAKGFDLLENLASKHFKITCYSNPQKNYDHLSINRMVPNRELPEIYNDHKFLLFPSRFESFGMAIAEALSCGLPVLVHPVGIGFELQKSIPEFVVNDFSDEKSLQEKIQKIEQHYSEYSLKARKYAEAEFSLDQFQKKWTEVLNA